MRAIEAGSIWFKWMLAAKTVLQYKIYRSEGSPDRSIHGWLFPRRFPTKRRLTASLPDGILVVEMPNKNKQALAVHTRYKLRSRARCKGDGGLSAHQQSLCCPVSGTPISSRPSSGTSVLWKSSIAKVPDPGANLKAANQQPSML